MAYWLRRNLFATTSCEQFKMALKTLPILTVPNNCKYPIETYPLFFSVYLFQNFYMPTSKMI